MDFYRVDRNIVLLWIDWGLNHLPGISKGRVPFFTHQRIASTFSSPSLRAMSDSVAVTVGVASKSSTYKKRNAGVLTSRRIFNIAFYQPSCICKGVVIFLFLLVALTATTCK